LDSGDLDIYRRVADLTDRDAFLGRAPAKSSNDMTWAILLVGAFWLFQKRIKKAVRDWLDQED
jgi:hypothetical protein